MLSHDPSAYDPSANYSSAYDPSANYASSDYSSANYASSDYASTNYPDSDYSGANHPSANHGRPNACHRFANACANHSRPSASADHRHTDPRADCPSQAIVLSTSHGPGAEQMIGNCCVAFELPQVSSTQLSSASPPTVLAVHSNITVRTLFTSRSLFVTSFHL